LTVRIKAFSSHIASSPQFKTPPTQAMSTSKASRHCSRGFRLCSLFQCPLMAWGSEDDLQGFSCLNESCYGAAKRGAVANSRDPTCWELQWGSRGAGSWHFFCRGLLCPAAESHDEFVLVHRSLKSFPSLCWIRGRSINNHSPPKAKGKPQLPGDGELIPGCCWLNSSWGLAVAKLSLPVLVLGSSSGRGSCSRCR